MLHLAGLKEMLVCRHPTPSKTAEVLGRKTNLFQSAQPTRSIKKLY